MTRPRMGAPILGLIAIVVGCAGLVGLPTVRTTLAANRTIHERQRRLEAPDGAPELIEHLLERRRTIETLASADMTPIPVEASVAPLIGELSELLDDLGLERREITTGAIKVLEEASSLPMSVLLEGPCLSITKAVRRIESLPRLVRVQRLRIDAKQPRTGPLDPEPEVRADLLIEIFFAPRDVGAGKEKGATR